MPPRKSATQALLLVVVFALFSSRWSHHQHRRHIHTHIHNRKEQPHEFDLILAIKIVSLEQRKRHKKRSSLWFWISHFWCDSVYGQYYHTKKRNEKPRAELCSTTYCTIGISRKIVPVFCCPRSLHIRKRGSPAPLWVKSRVITPIQKPEHFISSLMLSFQPSWSYFFPLLHCNL